MLESKFQAKLIKDIKQRFPGSKVSKQEHQGYPDLLILYKDKWAMLECKQTEKSSRRPNQEFYVNEFNEMSFARFISPETREEVLNELQRSFET